MITPSKDLARLADRIFISAVVGQVVLILLIFLLGLSLQAWNSDREAEQKIKSNFNEWAPSITEAVYVNSKTESFSLSDLPVLKDFENALKINGVSTKTRVANCGRGHELEKEFSLKIGEFDLDHCLYIERTDSFALKSVLFGFGLASLSLLLSVLGWLLWRGRFKSKILNPIVEGLEREARDAAVGKMASQIAHDIRSPLAALNIFMKDAGVLPEEKRVLLRSAVSRIQDIANNLLPAQRKMQKEMGAPVPTSLQPHLLTSLVESIVSEKRLRYRDARNVEITFKLDEPAYGAFAKVDPVEFQRVISNLIDNAVEAIAGKGRVVVLIENTPKKVKVSVVDNGRGIPANVLPKLMVKGASFNKAGGNGLGLAHARQTIEAWSGEIRIESEVDKGTKLSFILARESAPAWFLEEVRIGTEKIVIIDDDESIHQTWLEKFRAAGLTDLEKRIQRFYSLEEASRFLDMIEATRSQTLFLVDYEFVGSSENGLAWILRHQLQANSVLVTSRHDEPAVKNLCEKMKLRLLPKSLSPIVPVRLGENTSLSEREDTWVRALR